jgi:hypothetical protein
MPTIEGWGSPSCVRSVVQKIGEDNPKARKINQTLNQVPTLGQNMIKFEHDRPQNPIREHVEKGMMV